MSGGGIRLARVVMSGGGWPVTMDAGPEINGLIGSLRRVGGHAVTHVAELEREDGSAFDSDQLTEAINVLGYLLTAWECSFVDDVREWPFGIRIDGTDSADRRRLLRPGGLGSHRLRTRIQSGSSSGYCASGA
jgi:hypothetical protein